MPPQGRLPVSTEPRDDAGTMPDDYAHRYRHDSWGQRTDWGGIPVAPRFRPRRVPGWVGDNPEAETVHYIREAHPPIEVQAARGRPSLFDWSASGPWRRIFRPMAYEKRREFMQNAQTFSGLHSLVTPGARMPTGAWRMIPARRSRLTIRESPTELQASQAERVVGGDIPLRAQPEGFAQPSTVSSVLAATMPRRRKRVLV